MQHGSGAFVACLKVFYRSYPRLICGQSKIEQRAMYMLRHVDRGTKVLIPFMARVPVVIYFTKFVDVCLQR